MSKAIQELVDSRYAKRPAIRSVVLFGILALILVFGGFGSWAALAPLASAAIAPGQISVEGNSKTIQHLNGGIVQDVFVRDGDTVRKGDVLVRLDELELQTQQNLLQSQYWAGLALRARLVAEERKQDRIFWPETLWRLQQTAAVAQIITDQQRLFESRHASLKSQRDILTQQIQQLNSQIDAFQAQIRSTEQQYRYIKEEISGVQVLYDKGLERKPRLLALQRQQAQLIGRKGELKGQVARAREQISESEFRLSNLEIERQNEVASQLSDVQVNLAELQDRLATTEEQLHRLEITAPYDGVVFNLAYTNEGAVIPPNGEVLSIVPQQDQLIIEARVRPTDIDLAQIGGTAQVRLTAFKQRNMPMVEGTVLKLSADTVTDQMNGEQYYQASVELEAKALQELPDVQLVPGMPVEVLIHGGDRTAWEYLVGPLQDSFALAFRED